jgi:hypothetical protein
MEYSGCSMHHNEYYLFSMASSGVGSAVLGIEPVDMSD